MNTQEATQKYVMAFADLRMDSAITAEERDRRAQALAKELIDQDDDTLINQVLNRFGAVDGVLYGFLAEQVERHLERREITLPDGSAQLGTLIAIPVLCYGPIGTPLPEEIDIDFLPPLPDGRPIPRCSSVLLNWADLYMRTCHARQLHTVLGEDGASDTRVERDERVRTWRGPATEDWLNDCARRDGESGSMRFLVAYRLPTDPEWFESEAQMYEWGRMAFGYARRLAGEQWTVVLLAPRPLITALYAAHAQYVAFRHEEFEGILAGRGLTRADVDLLVEAFGIQRSSIAAWIRYSAFSKKDGSAVSWVAHPMNTLTMRHQWRDRCERRRQSLLEFGFEHVAITALVQPLQMFPNIPGRRIHIYLGPTRAFVESPEEGLPLESAGNPDHEAAKWWEYEQKTAPLEVEGMLSLLAKEVGVPEQSVIATTAFVLLRPDWRWYSAIILDFEWSLREATGETHWPPSEEMLKVATGTMGLLSARAWIRHEVIDG